MLRCAEVRQQAPLHKLERKNYFLSVQRIRAHFFCVYKHFRPSWTSLHQFLPPWMNLCLACLSVTDCNHAVPKLHFTFLFEHTPMLHLQTLNLSTFFANYKFVICNSCYMILTEIKSIQLNFSLQLLFWDKEMTKLPQKYYLFTKCLFLGQSE